MLLGKRPRPPMRRTTSLTEFSADVAVVLEAATHPPPPPPPPAAVHQDQGAVAVVPQQYYCPPGPVPMEGVTVPSPLPGVDRLQPPGGSGASRHHQQQVPFPLIHHRHHLMDVRYYDSSGVAAAMLSPRRPRRNSADFQLETAHFLKACGLCNRRLKPGKDIYMYRGEIAFCSSECRQQQMSLDERKEKKCSLTSTIKKEAPQAATIAASTATTSEPSTAGNGETVAAA